jgi:sortase (surface protein transpeptidase)
MKPALLLAAALAGLAFAAPASGSPKPALLTIRALGIFNQPIGNGDAMLAVGPIWDPSVANRPGQGRPMVIAAHDVTPVPGYGAHGPFYDLVILKKSYLAEIRWHGSLFIYRFVSNPVWHPESDEEVVLDRGTEAVWFYSCWPRYTHTGRKWAEADLVAVRKP